MIETLKQIDKHLCEQDKSDAAITKEVFALKTAFARWGGGLTAVIGGISLLVAIVEIAKALAPAAK